MDVIKKFRTLILKAISAIAPNLRGVSVNYSRNSSQGDLTTNAALSLSKVTKRDPVEIASLIIPKILNVEDVQSAEIAGQGFINIKLQPKVWADVLEHIEHMKDDYGSSDAFEGTNVNIEFVSANPTGPIHIGNARGAITFDVLSSLLKKIGYNVTKEYYINDRGAQIDKLYLSAFLRYKQALGEKVDFDFSKNKDLYPGSYLVFVGKKLAEKYKNSLGELEESERKSIISKFAINFVMRMITRDLEMLQVKYDVFRSESDVCNSGSLNKCIEILESKSLLDKIALEKPKGKVSDDWKPQERLVFLSKKFGDTENRSLQRSGGDWSYFAGDLAYHYDKIQRGFNYMIVGLGSDHSGYVKRLNAAVAAISDESAKVDVKLYNIVRFASKGKSMKMSKRRGYFLSITQVIREVGIDAVRFTMLTRKSDAPLDFDLELLKEKSNDNPVYYVQYAHARSKSVMKNASELSNLPKDKPNLLLLSNEHELTLIKKLAKWPDVVFSAAKLCEPHRVSFYLLEVAEAFHSLWNMGKTNESLRFIIEDNLDLTCARLALIRSTSCVIASGLSVLGIKPANEM